MFLLLIFVAQNTRETAQAISGLTLRRAQVRVLSFPLTHTDAYIHTYILDEIQRHSYTYIPTPRCIHTIRMRTHHMVSRLNPTLSGGFRAFTHHHRIYTSSDIHSISTFLQSTFIFFFTYFIFFIIIIIISSGFPEERR